jgi:transcriptional regulator with XRE-family HTH domain
VARSLGQVIKAARNRAGLSQSAVARQAKIAASVLSNIEGGKRDDLRFETVARIAQVLGLSLDTVAHECGFDFKIKSDSGITSDLARLAELLKTAEREQSQASRSTGEAQRILAALSQARRKR